MIFRFFAEMTARKRVAGTEVQPILMRVTRTLIESNSVLESFGNARTLRNNNSSRFGKLVQMHLKLSAGEPQLIGTTTHNFLLEMPRVTRPPDGERNFHIFFQLLRGMSREELDARFLGTLDDHPALVASVRPPASNSAHRLSKFGSRHGRERVHGIVELAARYHSVQQKVDVLCSIPCLRRGASTSQEFRTMPRLPRRWKRWLTSG